MSKPNQKNELVVYNSIERRLREPRKEIVFPLTPTHRKELRILKNTNLGNLNSRLSVIRKLKGEEYFKKHKAEILRELSDKQKICQGLNVDWQTRLKKINLILEERRKIESKADIKCLNLANDYGEVADLKTIKNDRKYSIDEEQVADKIARDQFDKRYKQSFDEVSRRINDIETKYEEAINFGDLEIVKELYYIMKSSDKLFEKINNLKI